MAREIQSGPNIRAVLTRTDRFREAANVSALFQNEVVFKIDNRTATFRRGEYILPQTRPIQAPVNRRGK